MFLRVVLGSLRRRGRRKIAALAAIALGTGAATGLFAIFLHVGDRIRGEYRANRHNILVEPAVEGDYLDEDDLEIFRSPRFFWRNQITSYAPLLPVNVEVEGRGPAVLVGTTPQSWKIDGIWGVVVGDVLAKRWNLKHGDRLVIRGRALAVTGTVATGEEWDERIVVDLAVAQEIAGLPGKIHSIVVNAVTTPDSEIVEKYRMDPKSVTPQDYEKLSCTPFADTIARELAQEIPNAQARPIRKVTDSEGKLLRRVDAVLLLLAIAALAAGGLGVMSAMTATVVDRRKEIGLLKALGATNLSIAGIFLAEAALLAVGGSTIGYLLGWGAAAILGFPGSWVVYLLALGAAFVVAVGGMLLPLRLVTRLDPTVVLHEA